MEDEFILFYDSGIGGLSTLKATMKLLPNEKYIYFADDKNCPYGNKTENEIISIAERNLEKLFKRFKIKMVVFACNTLTTCCIGHFRGLYNIPFVGTEPALKLAQKESKSKRILAIMTAVTIRQEKYTNLLKKTNCIVYSIGFKMLAERIEKWLIEEKEINIEYYFNVINKLLKKDGVIDCLVLGCTHYCFIKKELEKRLKLKVIDGNIGVAKRIKSLVDKSEIKDYGESKVKIILSSENDKKIEMYYKILKER